MKLTVKIMTSFALVAMAISSASANETPSAINRPTAELLFKLASNDRRLAEALRSDRAPLIMANWLQVELAILRETRSYFEALEKKADPSDLANFQVFFSAAPMLSGGITAVSSTDLIQLVSSARAYDMRILQFALMVGNSSAHAGARDAILNFFRYSQPTLDYIREASLEIDVRNLADFHPWDDHPPTDEEIPARTEIARKLILRQRAKQDKSLTAAHESILLILSGVVKPPPFRIRLPGLASVLTNEATREELQAQMAERHAILERLLADGLISDMVAERVYGLVAKEINELEPEAGAARGLVAGFIKRSKVGPARCGPFFKL